jgi:hypothetical protein
MDNVFEGKRIMSRSEYVANVQGFSACSNKGRAAKVSGKGGLNVFKTMGFCAGVMLACMVVF